jgi:hypothetical protein
MADSSTDFVSVEGMTSMGEERSNSRYKYYGDQKGAAQLGLGSGGKLSSLTNEVLAKSGLDTDLSLFSKETNDDGISFTSKTK